MLFAATTEPVAQMVWLPMKTQHVVYIGIITVIIMPTYLSVRGLCDSLQGRRIEARGALPGMIYQVKESSRVAMT